MRPILLSSIVSGTGRMCNSCRSWLGRERPLPHLSIRLSSTLSSRPEIDQYLSTSSWSVKTLLSDTPVKETGSKAPGSTSSPEGPPSSPTSSPSPSPPPTHRISSDDLARLLRLSALPKPASASQEAKLLDSLSSQVQFVAHVQEAVTRTRTEAAASQLPTEHPIRPLVTIRDESTAALEESIITLETPAIKRRLASEEMVGKYFPQSTLRRDDPPWEETKEAENWEPLKYSSRVTNGYYVVRRTGGRPGKENDAGKDGA